MKKSSKKLKLIIVFLGAIIFNIPTPLAASTAALGISGNEKQNVGSTFTLDFGIASNTGSVVAVQGNVIVEDTNCVKFKKLDYLNDSADTENNVFNFLNARGKTGDFSLVRGTFEAGSSACTTYIKITNGAIELTDTTLRNLTSSKKIVVGEATPPTPSKSSDATLKSLSPSVGSLSPAFKSTTTSYTLEVDENTKTVNFNATPNHSAGKVTSGTSCTLSTSSNTTTCKITVTAENGTKKDYEVKVNKKTNNEPPSNDEPKPTEPTKSSDADLKSLDIKDYSLSPKFSKDSTSYSITVDKDVNSLDIDATANDKNAKVKISGNSSFKDGMNTVNITVTAEDGTKKIYTINVFKKSDNNSNNNPVVNKSTDNTLSSLLIKNGEISPKFDKNVSNYSVNIPNDIDKLDISAITTDKKAKVKVTGNENLSVGMNTVTIEVTAEDGSVRYYTINVNKSEEKSNNKLSTLEVNGHVLSPTFDKNIFSYDITVPNDVNSLDIKALAENENAKVEIIGNKDLKEGNNVILVKVVDENGFSQYYTLNVNKEAKQEAKFLGLTWKSWLLISGFLLLLGLLLFIIILLKKHKKKEKNVRNDIKQAPVIEFKPEFNFGSKNGTDDDIVEEGGILNQYSGIEPPKETPKEIEYVEEADYQDKPVKDHKTEEYYEEDYEDEDTPYDPYDETITKAEIVDAIHEAIKTKDPEKLQLLLDQDELNQRKKKLKAKEKQKRSRSDFDDYDD